MRESHTLRVWIAFLFAAIPALVFPVFIPSLRLVFFAPFLVLMFYKKPFTQCLWLAFGCGLFMDLLAPYPRLGVLALTYCLASIGVYRAKARFFEDSSISLPIMTFFFVVISTIFELFLLKLFTSGPTLSLRWIITDLLMLPLVDALYAWIWFALPAHLLRRRPIRAEWA